MPVSLSALIVDDEPLACERLRALLEAEPGVQVTGICGHGREALAAVRRGPPDLVFLDVQMPEMDGFTFLETLAPAPLPLVVVVTAHEKYAVRAFEVHAVDYLLKPFDRARLRQTLQHVEERLQAVRAAQLQESMAAFRGRLTPPPPPQSDRIPVKEKGRIVLVKVEDIDWLAAAENYVELHTGKTSSLFLSTLTAFASRLPAAQFVRISRSTIVNFTRVKEICFHRNGDGVVVLFNGTRLAFSRSHRRKLAQFSGQK